MIFDGKINHSKMCLFLKIRIVPADGEEGETEAGADGGEASFELGIPAEREKGEVAAANP